MKNKLLFWGAVLAGMQAFNVMTLDELLPGPWFKAIAGLLAAAQVGLAFWTAGLHTPAPGYPAIVTETAVVEADQATLVTPKSHRAVAAPSIKDQL